MGGLAPSRWLGEHGYTAGGWEHGQRAPAAHRKGRSRGRHLAARPRPCHHRSARSSPTRSGSSFDDVDVLHGDTDIAAWGLDTYGSRSLVGWRRRRSLQAARKVVDKARAIAAHLLEASPDDLEFADGRFSGAR